jgi:predicted phosphoribosyltransferase
LLGEKLLQEYGLETLKEAVVLGCPRGGLLFAKGVVDVIREAGGDPILDLIISRKILAPGTKDYGIGAITEQGEVIYVDRIINSLNLDVHSLQMEESIEGVRQEVSRRVAAYRQGKPLVSLDNKVVVVIDGVVGGGTMIACVKSVQTEAQGKAKRIIVATPVASLSGKMRVISYAAIPPEDFCATVLANPPKGTFWNSDDFYERTKSFEQMTDEEVREILATYARTNCGEAI